MNLIGKIFTVLIFVMALLFMGFVMAVYATHKNWRDIVMNPRDNPLNPVAGLKFQLEDAENENKELKAQLQKLTDSLASEKADKRQTLAKLENENDELKRERDQQAQELDRLNTDERRAVAAMDAAHKTLDGLRAEVDTLRRDIETARQARLDHFDKVVQLTDDLHQSVNERTTLKSRNTSLAADYAAAVQVLRKFDLQPNPAVYIGEPVTDVHGNILAVRAGGLIELSIGSDDGVMPGHLFEVTRQGPASMYLGRVEITDVAPDKSVAKVLPQFQKGAMQRGDFVKAKKFVNN